MSRRHRDISHVKLENVKVVIKLAGQITDYMIKDSNYIKEMYLAVRQEIDTSLRILLSKGHFSKQNVVNSILGIKRSVQSEP